MHVTLEQARALDALAQHGTFARAAEALQKRHTAVLYALRTLEKETGLALLDRAGYRTKLTEAGERVLALARKLLAAERELADACAELSTGWEPELRLVFDGIYPVEAVLDATMHVARAGARTRVDVSTEFLEGVEQSFVARDAHLMIAVLPPRQKDLRVLKLPPIRARLVAHRSHPLARARENLEPAELTSHVLLTVRGSDPRLQLSTQGLEPPIAVRLNDFHGKKAGILAGFGYGWMPEYLVRAELDRGELVALKWKGEGAHLFEPRLYYRSGRAPGRAARMMIERLRGK